MGGNAALARKYGCPIAIPEGERALVERWDETSLWLEYAGQVAERFTPNEALHPDTTHIWGDLEWQAIAAPGHDMGALVFYNPEHRILISGDALWEYGFGLVMPPEVDPAALPATRATLEMLAALNVAIVIPGHGNVHWLRQGARRCVSGRTFEADPMRMAARAQSDVRVTLLDRRGWRSPTRPLLDGIEMYRDFNARYFACPPQARSWLVAELEKAVVRRRKTTSFWRDRLPKNVARVPGLHHGAAPVECAAVAFGGGSATVEQRRLRRRLRGLPFDSIRHARFSHPHPNVHNANRSRLTGLTCNSCSKTRWKRASFRWLPHSSSASSSPARACLAFDRRRICGDDRAHRGLRPHRPPRRADRARHRGVGARGPDRRSLAAYGARLLADARHRRGHRVAGVLVGVVARGARVAIAAAAIGLFGRFSSWRVAIADGLRVGASASTGVE
jgi:glyoxylase-like metal-dependent hydrolase (beta-lactamase superfamily II)